MHYHFSLFLLEFKVVRIRCSTTNHHQITQEMRPFIYFIKLLKTCSTNSFLFIYFYFICHTIMNYKWYRICRKKKWQGDLTETIGAYERLGILKLRARAVYINWRKGGIKLKMEIKIGNSYLLNNLIFSIFVKEKRDWEFCWTHCHSELKNLGPWKKGENFLVFGRQYGRWFYIQWCTCGTVKSN